MAGKERRRGGRQGRGDQLRLSPSSHLWPGVGGSALSFIGAMPVGPQLREDKEVFDRDVDFRVNTVLASGLFHPAISSRELVVI